MNIQNLSWRRIRAFLLVVQYGSFTAAAEASGLSKSNLSQQVSELESALGVQLLFRTTRKLRLTEAGEGYFERCQQAFQQLHSANEWVQQNQEEVAGSISVNTVGGPIGEQILGPLLIEFQTQHPSVQIQLDFSSTRVDLLEDQYDLVIRMGALPDSTLTARQLQLLRTRYVASPKFIAQYPNIRTPKDLRGLPLIYGSVDHWILSKGEEQQVVQVEQGMRIISGRVMRQAALAGLGITRLTDIYIQHDIDQGHLVEVLPDWSTSTPLSMVCPPHQHQLRRIKVLMDWLKMHFAKRYAYVLRNGLE